MVGPALALSIIAADLNHDGIINSGDAAILFHEWGQQTASDVNMDGTVDTQDLTQMLTLWRAGWGAHQTGDGRVWFAEPGTALSVGPSPFDGLRRLRFVSAHGDIMAIDMPIPDGD